MQKNTFIIPSSYGRNMLADVQYISDGKPKAVIVFSHGFKGFKDWGAFNAVAQYFASHSYVFVKFNFSANGTTIDAPLDFDDLNAFSENTYTRELDELGMVLDHLPSMPEAVEMDLSKIYLLGHSRGGAISILKTAEDSRVKKLVSWAAVADFEARFPKGTELEEWKAKAYYEIYNGRTKQQMPVRYSFYEDFIANRKRLDIPERMSEVKTESLIIHGTADPTVSIADARLLQQKNPAAHLLELSGAGHTFDTVHPPKEKLPKAMRIALGATEVFFAQD